MKKTTILLFLGSLLSACHQQQPTSSPHDRTPETKASFSIEGKEVKLFTTALNTDLRLSPTTTTAFAPATQPIETEISVFVNPDKTFQTLLGIGGALTDASAEVFAQLPEVKQQELLTAYYDLEDGIGYTLARTSIHSCDFSSGSYTYVSGEDKELSTFTIDHDRTYRIPFIRKAIEAAGGELTLFASPWSPPAYMKSNNNMLKGGKLLPDFYESWALYFTKFIKAYESEGIPIWGITIQNEPMAIQTWESCIYTAEEERDFLKNFLGPILEKEGLGEKKIIVWDHNRDLASHRAHVIFDDPEASRYAWGLGFHWYETWTGGEPMFINLDNISESYPDKKLLFTEGTPDSFHPSRYQHWPNAERYGESMIRDFNQGTVGWTDWNILLDQQGGPNHVGNYCFAPVHANTETGELIYTPSYYYIGHFSKFIRPNAKRVSTTTSRSNLIACSFLNEERTLVTVVMNKTSEEIPYRLYIGSNGADVKIQPHAIQTFVIR